ncbi:hypothetical protein GLE_1729 [Lysobacter enzymogenes]|uniref:Uncharacterized protein n=1 Tax=Lysobacter enzymogenes TaxID=69 RepID=A0A0S2DEX6_LYSEN|nr:hypothetical protein GLE_1729 [Lysobacter enzymogenes]
MRAQGRVTRTVRGVSQDRAFGSALRKMSESFIESREFASIE